MFSESPRCGCRADADWAVTKEGEGYQGGESKKGKERNERTTVRDRFSNGVK